MSRLRVVIAVSLIGVWVIGYLMAYFVDRSLADIAKGATPLASIAASFLLGTEALKIVKGNRE